MLFIPKNLITHLYTQCISKNTSGGVKISRNLVKPKFGIQFSNYSQKAETENDVKPSFPSPEAGKIQAAVLKDFRALEIVNCELSDDFDDDEVLIDVNYCAINGTDVLLRDNGYTFKPKLPLVLGYELVGKVAKLGEDAQKQGLKIGDKVVALNKKKFGGFAEQCIASVKDVWRIPSTIRSVDAVCLLENYMTALIGLELQAQIEEDDLILISVGFSGTGLAAIDLATNVFRAQVIGVSSTEERASIVRDRGAFASLKFHDKKLIKEIEKLAKERNLEHIFDGKEGENFKKLINGFTDVYKTEPPSKYMLRDDNFGVVVQHLSREARVILAGVTGNENDSSSADDNPLVVSGINLRDFRKHDFERYRQAGDDVIGFYEENLIKPTHSMIAGLYNINEAMNIVFEMKSSGKVIIDIKDKTAEPKMT